MTDKNLIIIASQPRSGSTLLQALLSNNSQVGTVSEPWFLLPFLGYNKRDLHKATYNSNYAREGIEEFKNKIGSKLFNQDLSSFLLSQYQKILSQNEIFVLDKTPRYYEILDNIVEYFPNCKIIILKRHPMSVLQSIIKTWKVKNIDDLLEYKRDILNAPFILHSFCLKNNNNPNVYILNYEDLVEYPERNSKALYDWLGIKFDEQILNYSSNEKFKGSFGDPTGINISKKPNKSSIDKWESLSNDNYWESFISGYFEYLTPKFLEQYGNYTVIGKVDKSLKFEVFLQKSKWSFKEFEVPKIKLLKFSILRRLRLLK